MAERANDGADHFMMAVQCDERQVVVMSELLKLLVIVSVWTMCLEPFEKVLGVLKMTSVLQDDLDRQLLQIALGNAIK